MCCVTIARIGYARRLQTNKGPAVLMSVELKSLAEKRAEVAQSLPCFSGLNLLHVKREVAELLGQIGGQGIFDEYTKHDISHIDSMLNLLDWVIPKRTQESLSPADWLLIVLAVYFHDMGMLVTKAEYVNRGASEFPAYRDSILASEDPSDTDYRAKIESLPDDQAERFLYQEFVRDNHAKRVRCWITGVDRDSLGITRDVAQAVDDLLNTLDGAFRNDLGLTAESHHLDDLDDFKKYKVSQPYGQSADETANVQYAAIILRTVDLLHVTSDRTPSIAFRAINPTDPMSQREWAKQMAVRSVRSQLGTDDDGNMDPNAPRDTIEVHANFTNEGGFFGLTSYLDYAEDQLRKSQDWVETAKRLKAADQEFPWRRIDQSFIETEGFLRDQYEFTIDQAKILDLLTGHTLYNDTSVVLRELVQNALDAVRLQFFDPRGEECLKRGRVTIHWDTERRVLTVRDNGTGMTQDIVDRHLLKVGASRYQDPKFQEEHPHFSPISRFGIGILSSFMVADSVEVITSHPDEPQARQMLLRSVHGKYLIKLLDKENDADARAIGDHGTTVRLAIRTSAQEADVEEIARRWIVIPGCNVTLQVDEGPEQTIGYGSASEALEDYLNQTRTGRFKVEERTSGGVSVAYALQWSETFKEWSFVETHQRASIRSLGRVRHGSRDSAGANLGTCVEGIRVEGGTPALPERPIYSIANVTGKKAPRTNVARSGLESTPERGQMVRTILAIYGDHVREEVERLSGQQGFSLTWAVGEAQYLAAPLIPETRISREVEGALQDIPALIVEKGGKRVAVSVRQLSEHESFWTVDSALFRSAEFMLREISGDASLNDVTRGLPTEDCSLPGEPLLSTARVHAYFLNSVFRFREPEEVRIDRPRRRLDVRWGERAENPCWLYPFRDLPRPTRRYQDAMEETHRRWTRARSIVIPLKPIDWVGRTDETSALIQGDVYLAAASPIADFLASLPTPQEADMDLVDACWASIEFAMLALDMPTSRMEKLEQEVLPNLVRVASLDQHVDVGALTDALRSTDRRTFSTSAWERSDD